VKNLRFFGKEFWLTVFLVAGIVLVDRTSKEIVWSGFREQIVWNNGISLGFLATNDLFSKIILQIVICLAVFGFLYWLVSEFKKKDKNYFVILPLGMVVAGGVSNLIDRMLWGSVMDFIPFFGLWTFNIADFSISVGVILLLINKLAYDFWKR